MKHNPKPQMQQQTHNTPAQAGVNARLFGDKPPARRKAASRKLLQQLIRANDLNSQAKVDQLDYGRLLAAARDPIVGLEVPVDD
eukprot:CAMPEP_0176007404 /NCGR_PEP_ID=MMETSP0120_2-20121206/3216_1 /TAXON_ID=160619 /ORGANISM="Kryptoperidinium foliaceum, Strain CCMP 1326" /LENGTH=83 /DNA_ID=CAMNT_0017340165 /DNA_START=137 /DNA_END=390 /DNA_ORIENTATION=-